MITLGIKLGIVFGGILILSLWKFPLWYIIMTGTVLFSLLFNITPLQYLSMLKVVLLDMNSWRIITIVFLSLLLGLLMKTSGLFEKISEETKKLKRKGLVSIISPMLIGLIPMPGGALISAPLVEAQLKDSEMEKARMAYINYWYRHVWEYAWPLYPGIIIMSGLLHAPIKRIILPLIPFIIVAFLSGLPFVKNLKSDEENGKFSILRFLLYISPILFVIVGILSGLSALLSLLIPDLFLLFLSFKKGTLNFKGLKISILPAIIFIFLFKNLFNTSFTVHPDPSLPSWVIFSFMIVFSALSGFITGLNQAAVGIAIPFVISMSFPQNVFLNSLIAYVSLFFGILISPSHLCLILTAKYFKTDLPSMFRFIIPSLGILILFSIVWFIFLGFIL